VPVIIPPQARLLFAAPNSSPIATATEKDLESIRFAFIHFPPDRFQGCSTRLLMVQAHHLLGKLTNHRWIVGSYPSISVVQEFEIPVKQV
jgi:hypothetical protein